MKFTIVNYDFNFRQEPWSRGYGRTLMLKMLWVQIPASEINYRKSNVGLSKVPKARVLISTLMILILNNKWKIPVVR